MSYKYGFFDSVDLGNGNYDRVYSSAEFSHYWALLVGNGVFTQPSTSLNVVATTPVSMSIKVLPGTGWIKGHYLTIPDNNDESIVVPVADPSLPRIDSIIMALNNNDRDMTLYVRSGTAAVSPTAVTLQRYDGVWELELAQITLAAGAGNITQQSIRDMRTDPDRCGIVTGLIDQLDVSGFFTAARASFDEWFEGVRGELGGDAAGNLYNKIERLEASNTENLNNLIENLNQSHAFGHSSDKSLLSDILAINASISLSFSGNEKGESHAKSVSIPAYTKSVTLSPYASIFNIKLVGFGNQSQVNNGMVTNEAEVQLLRGSTVLCTTKVTLEYRTSSIDLSNSVTQEMDIPKQYRNSNMELTLKIIPTRVWSQTGGNTVKSYGIKILSASCNTPQVFEGVSINS